jgi:WD40 repeat protein
LPRNLPPAIRNLPVRTRRLAVGAAAAVTIGAAVAIRALLAAPAHPGIAGSTGHTGTVYSVAFSPDGKMLAGAGRDGTVRLWDIATHRQIGNPIAVPGPTVTSVAFSADGTTLATGSEDHTVRLWDVATHNQIGDPIVGHAGPVFSGAGHRSSRPLDRSQRHRIPVAIELAILSSQLRPVQAIVSETSVTKVRLKRGAADSSHKRRSP